MSECPESWKCWRCFVRYKIQIGKVDSEHSKCPECGLSFWHGVAFSDGGRMEKAAVGITPDQYRKLQIEKRAV